MDTRSTIFGLAVAVSAAVTMSAAAQPRSAPPAAGRPLAASARCDTGLGALVSAAPDLKVISAVDQADSTTPDGRRTPQHCEVIGSFDRHVGVDGQTYAIRFHLRLPAAWNGRFFFQGGGGSNGVLGSALGDLQGGQLKTALQLGYAVVSQDSGHDNDVNGLKARGGAAAFGWDQRAREDYAYRSQARTTVVAKQLLGAYYGQGPAFSYWVGCSKGGQEGIAMAARYPDYFDGVIADAPGFALPKAAIAEAWDTQAMAEAARALGAFDKAGLPLLNAAFSDADLGLAADAIARACDRLDGAADGIVGDFAACTTARVRPQLEAARCRAGKSPDCLAVAQIKALVRVFDGARDSRGLALYSDWAWDLGIGGAPGGRLYSGWRAWKIGSAGGQVNDSRNVTLGGSSLASGFTTPPTAVDADPEALARYLLGFDFDRDAPRIFSTSADYPVSAWDLMNAQSNLDGFRARGGRLIIVQGVSDPVFSIRDTARWWDRLNVHSRGAAARSVRLFPVPGMNHCRGGPGTTDFDAFSALVGWVEKGAAPAEILATAPSETPWPGRTRPLCSYPAVAVYQGRGDMEKASSFSCRRRAPAG